MVSDLTSDSAENNQLTPLHELMSRILIGETPLSRRLTPIFPVAGTLQSLNDRLKKQPWLDFINYTLRGIGQVIFVNNPLSGFLILIALFIQSSWVGWMSLHLGDRLYLNRDHSSARSRNYS